MQVRAADAGLVDAHEDVVDPGSRIGHGLEAEAWTWAGLHEREHQVTVVGAVYDPILHLADALDPAAEAAHGRLSSGPETTGLDGAGEGGVHSFSGLVCSPHVFQNSMIASSSNVSSGSTRSQTSAA